VSRLCTEPFANDVVYELVPDLTVGSELGWKAARTHTSWGPLAKHNVHNSPIDGIHIMQRFPPFALVPTDFTPRCHDTLTSTMQYMQSKSLFGSGTVFEPTRADWEQFKANFFPWNDSVEQYVERYPDRFENPLEALVTLTFTTNRSNDNETITLHFDDDNGDSGAMRAVAEDDTHILGLHDDEEDYAADAEAYLESTIDFDATRLVTLNPAIQNQVAGHSVRHSNNGQKLPVLPYRIPIPKGVNPNARDIDLAALRMNALFQPPTEDLTELTVMELEARLVARSMAQSTVNTFKGSKFHLVCSLYAVLGQAYKETEVTEKLKRKPAAAVAATAGSAGSGAAADGSGGSGKKKNPYKAMKKDELIHACNDRRLSSVGTVPMLRDRLLAEDDRLAAVAAVQAAQNHLVTITAGTANLNV